MVYGTSHLREYNHLRSTLKYLRVDFAVLLKLGQPINWVDKYNRSTWTYVYIMVENCGNTSRFGWGCSQLLDLSPLIENFKDATRQRCPQRTYNAFYALSFTCFNWGVAAVELEWIQWYRFLTELKALSPWPGSSTTTSYFKNEQWIRPPPDVSDGFSRLCEPCNNLSRAYAYDLGRPRG